MLYVATLYASDVMDQVHAHLAVRAYPQGSIEPSSIVFECTTTFPGTGELDPREWIRDALVGCLEDI